MLLEVDTEKRQALIDLMALPDAPDLHRGHHLTIAGREDRYRMVHHLAATFVQWRHIQAEERSAEYPTPSLHSRS